MHGIVKNEKKLFKSLLRLLLRLSLNATYLKTDLKGKNANVFVLNSWGLKTGG